MALSIVRNLDLYIVINTENRSSLVYGKELCQDGTLVYYNPTCNLVTLSNQLEKAKNAKVIGYPYPEFLEKIPCTGCKKILKKPSKNGKFITTLKTISSKSGLELIIDIQEIINNIPNQQGHFSIKNGDSFDYDLLKEEKK